MPPLHGHAKRVAAAPMVRNCCLALLHLNILIPGTEPCDVGQACFWFASGCTIGCDTCDGNGRRNGDPCRCEQCANATVNDPKYRTANRNAKAGSAEDIYKYNPVC